MDKYELEVRVEQIKKLARQKDYAAAAKIADTVDFYRIRENRTLSLLADVYEASGKYDKAKDILIEAYERTTLGRQLAYRLVKLCIKSGNVSEAEEFYQDFVKAAPRDNSKYILQYELASAKGEPLENRISILETYLSDEMDEKWAFELAKLYHKTGQKDKCVRQCDDVILWFSEGKYVDKAMELKMIYAPLSRTQQAKYEERWRAKAPSGVNVEEIKVKEYDAQNKYNTVNIQNAIKESMDILMNEDDKMFQGNEQESQGKQDKKAEELAKTKVVFSDEVVNRLLSHTVKDIRVPSTKYNTVPLDPMFDMDSHGQIELSIEEPVDDQIEGQMTIEELLTAYEEREAKEEQRKQQIQEMQQTIRIDLQEEKETEAEEKEENKETQTEENAEDYRDNNGGAEDILSVTADLSVIEQALVEAAMTEENSAASYNEDNQAETQSFTDENETETEAEPEVNEEPAEEPVEAAQANEEPAEEPGETYGDDEADDASEDYDDEVSSEVAGQMNDNAGSQADNNEVKELIKEFVSKYSGVQGLDRQLLKVLQEALIRQNAHIVVMGEVKSGKTALAIDLVKIVNKIKQVRGRKIAKINGELLNGKNVADYFDKLRGMDLIIEKAGALSTVTVKDIVTQVENDTENKIIVIEDEKSNAKALLEANENLDKLFSSRLIVKQNKIRDWAVVAKDYAKEHGYEIDEMGMLALHAKIDELYAISLVLNKGQVETVIDEAIQKSEKRGFGRILKIFGKEKEKILKEEDFE